MAIVKLEYDGRNVGLKKLIEAFIALGGKVKEEEDVTHYDPEFVKKIRKSEKSKGVKIATEDLWK
jgi:hypothetical protein